MAKFRGEVQNRDACRIFGALEIHKCQGDFHITARGHGYQSFGANHLDHDSMSPDCYVLKQRNKFHSYHRRVLLRRVLSKYQQSP